MMIQFDDSADVQEVDFGKAFPPATIPVSPLKAYQIVTGTTNGAKPPTRTCQGGKCRSYMTLIWKQERFCQASLTCPHLQASPCEDFGLILRATSNNGTRFYESQVCNQDQLHTFPLSTGSQVDLTLWSLEGAAFKASCYFWCTSTGDFPTAAVKPQMDVKDIMVIMSAQFFC